MAFLYKDGLNPVARIINEGNQILSRQTFYYGEKPHVPAFMSNNGDIYRIISDHLDCLKIAKCPNGVYLDDGTIAGSTLTMDQALTNLLRLGLTEADAHRRWPTFPADYLGLADRGRIAVDAFADLVVLNEDNVIEQVYVEGQAIDLSHG
jgi:adenine deaminase